MKTTLLIIAAAGIGLVPSLALADTSTIKVDGGHTATLAVPAPGVSRDIPSIDDILAGLRKAKSAALTPVEVPRDLPPAFGQ